VAHRIDVIGSLAVVPERLRARKSRSQSPAGGDYEIVAWC